MIDLVYAIFAYGTPAAALVVVGERLLRGRWNERATTISQVLGIMSLAFGVYLAHNALGSLVSGAVRMLPM